MSEKEVSAGILIETESGKYLQCHCTGKKKNQYMTYDIPKGHVEGSESHLHTMLRELYEETGIDWRSNKEKITRIVDLGVQKYISSKDLHVFYTLIDDNEIDVDNLKCNSFFVRNLGGKDIELPEINAYQFSDNINYFYKSFQDVLERIKPEIEKAKSELKVHYASPNKNSYE